jgi:hypothetical protein
MMTIGEMMDLAEDAENGDPDAAKRLDDEAREMGFASWAEYSTQDLDPEVREKMREAIQAFGRSHPELSLDDPIIQAMLSRLRQFQHDPIIAAIGKIPVVQV